MTGPNGAPGSYFGVVIDITEQKLMEKALRESEERQSFLLSLNDALRAIGDPVEAIATASKMLGQKLGANQVVYAEIDAAGSAPISLRTGTTAGARSLRSLQDLRFRCDFVQALKSGEPSLSATCARTLAFGRPWGGDF